MFGIEFNQYNSQYGSVAMRKRNEYKSFQDEPDRFMGVQKSKPPIGKYAKIAAGVTGWLATGLVILKKLGVLSKLKTAITHLIKK